MGSVKVNIKNFTNVTMILSLYSNLLASLIGGSLSRSTTPIAYNDSVQREDTLNGDLPMIPFTIIQQATNYFSLSSKLGEGGFGPVYKV
jgi:hypothetical protein